MRARVVALVVVGLVLGVAGPTRAAPAAPSLTPSSYIVTLEPGGVPSTVASGLVAAVGGTLVHTYDHVLHGFSFIGTDLQASLLAADPAVASVVPDGSVHLTDLDVTPTGVSRIGAPAAGAAGHTGAGVTVAVIDSGIDILHPDLQANIDPDLGANCVAAPAPPLDDNSHGTHVAGIIAAADNDLGVVGVAPSAHLVAVKAFDATGDSTWAQVICGIDYVAAHADAIDVVNMSFGDLSTVATTCDGITTSDIDALRQSICDLSATGVISVAAAGNNMIDVAGFVPAVFPEVIAVSAYSDFDGQPGAAGGCVSVFGTDVACDDAFASLFSNFGPRIDVTAPGWEILSTIPGGLYETKDGTSMAAPHVAGALALLLQSAPDLTTAQVRSSLRRSGECPNGTVAGGDSSCAGQGLWGLDPDGVAEPLVDAEAVAALDDPPTAALTSPAGGATVAGTVTLAATASDDRHVASVAFTADGVTVATDTDGTNGWSATWDSRSVAGGTHVLAARATDDGGQATTSSGVTVTVANRMHIGDLDGAVVAAKRSRQVRVTVTVHSGTEGVVKGARVSFTWSGAVSGSGTCTTDRNGRCTATSPTTSAVATNVTLTVTSVVLTGQTYTAPTNHDPDGDSTGTAITVHLT